jgi:predicted CoA-binding protein
VLLPGCGYRILRVNPRGGELFDEKGYAPVPAVDLLVDVVDVFRPSDEAEAVAAGAIGIGARVLWFQPGTDTPQAAHLAREAGLRIVTGLCMGATHGQLGLGPGPTATRPD